MSSVRGQGPSDTLKASAKTQNHRSLVVSFEDNRLVAELLGEFDSHLALLEDRLGIEALPHGNYITLKGPEDTCLLARSILTGLYDRLARGEKIGAGDIDGVIRHMSASHLKAREKNNHNQKHTSKGNGVQDHQTQSHEGEQAQIRTRKKVISARTPMQSNYIRALHKKDLVFATGPAGTGKTYMAVAYAASCWERGETDRIILSRPAVEAGERLGFLPGDMRDKVDPYLRPLYDALYDVLPPEKVERGLETGAIEIAPLAFMRGRTLANAFIILDEAQNCTAMQMKMFLTRLGEKSKMVITGDPTQIDLPKGMTSGLVDAIAILKSIDDIEHIAFARGDVVRRELVAKIVAAYERKR